MIKVISFLILFSTLTFADTVTKNDCKVFKVTVESQLSPGGVARFYDKVASIKCGTREYLVVFENEMEPQFLAALSGKLKVNVELSSTENKFWDILKLELQ